MYGHWMFWTFIVAIILSIPSLARAVLGLHSRERIDQFLPKWRGPLPRPVPNKTGRIALQRRQARPSYEAFPALSGRNFPPNQRPDGSSKYGPN